MFRRVCVAALLIVSMPALSRAQAENVRFDPRVEVVSILFYLAGVSEYAMHKNPAYEKAVDAWFAPYTTHRAVAETRKAASELRARFFHPMNLAVHVTMPPALAERTPFDQPGHNLGTRWTPAPTREYLDAVREFYRDAKVEEFLTSQATRINLTIDRLKAVLRQHGDPGWFATYFGGDRGTDFFVVPGLLTGGAQYGPTYRDGRGAEEAFAVIGVYKTDADGNPSFDAGDAMNVVHEFAHTLTNRAVTAHLAAMSTAGPKIFETVQPKMRQQNYGEWQTMMYETVVRTVVVRFIEAHEGAAAAQKEADAQAASGFILVGPIATLLGDYEKQRAQYPTFAAFMPKIVELVNAKAPAY